MSLGAFIMEYGSFLAAYRWAPRKAREYAETPVSERFIEGWLAPVLVPIVAGYHVAHFLTLCTFTR